MNASDETPWPRASRPDRSQDAEERHFSDPSRLECVQRAVDEIAFGFALRFGRRTDNPGCRNVKLVQSSRCYRDSAASLN